MNNNRSGKKPQVVFVHEKYFLGTDMLRASDPYDAITKSADLKNDPAIKNNFDIKGLTYDQSTHTYQVDFKKEIRSKEPKTFVISGNRTKQELDGILLNKYKSPQVDKGDDFVTRDRLVIYGSELSPAVQEYMANNAWQWDNITFVSNVDDLKATIQGSVNQVEQKIESSAPIANQTVVASSASLAPAVEERSVQSATPEVRTNTEPLSAYQVEEPPPAYDELPPAYTEVDTNVVKQASSDVPEAAAAAAPAAPAAAVPTAAAPTAAAPTAAAPTAAAPTAAAPTAAAPTAAAPTAAVPTAAAPTAAAPTASAPGYGPPAGASPATPTAAAPTASAPGYGPPAGASLATPTAGPSFAAGLGSHSPPSSQAMPGMAASANIANQIKRYPDGYDSSNNSRETEIQKTLLEQANLGTYHHFTVPANPPQQPKPVTVEVKFTQGQMSLACYGALTQQEKENVSRGIPPADKEAYKQSAQHVAEQLSSQAFSSGKNGGYYYREKNFDDLGGRPECTMSNFQYPQQALANLLASPLIPNDFPLKQHISNTSGEGPGVARAKELIQALDRYEAKDAKFLQGDGILPHTNNELIQKLRVQATNNIVMGVRDPAALNASVLDAVDVVKSIRNSEGKWFESDFAKTLKSFISNDPNAEVPGKYVENKEARINGLVQDMHTSYDASKVNDNNAGPAAAQMPKAR